MQKAERLSLERIRAFLEAREEVEFEAKEIYEWVRRTMCEQEYRNRGREGEGLLRRYLAKMNRAEPGADDTANR